MEIFLDSSVCVCVFFFFFFKYEMAKNSVEKGEKMMVPCIFFLFHSSLSFNKLSMLGYIKPVIVW